MSLKITVSGAGSVSIRVDRATCIEVDATGGIRILIGDDPDGASVSIESRVRNRRGTIAEARRVSGGVVTSAMEAAAIEAFLAGADVSRLGRSLASVYSAMEAVRRNEGDDEC